MHLLKIILLVWLSFGTLMILGFLWLGSKGVQSLNQGTEKETSRDRHEKAPAMACSKAA
jgi:hypothetical protein